MAKKAYAYHETLYRHLAASGARSWNEPRMKRAIEPGVQAFIEDVLAQPWAPKTGRAIELGCGTAPVLRWLHSKGWRGEGVDISSTAIRMARREARGTGLVFTPGDVTLLGDRPASTFDLALDGRCHHCLTEPADRARFFAGAARLLRSGGAFILSTMCAPLLKREFEALHHPVAGGVVFTPVADAQGYRGAKRIRGKWHLPSQALVAWPAILKLMRKCGLEPRLIRLNLAHKGDPLSYLSVGATRVGAA
ncbi:MAG: class I SAM-dependent methyltransferase [Planctomycetes bacterium]|nr:class I SAM-dependent methyltransferase [Planctomycetota bacterium]